MAPLGSTDFFRFDCLARLVMALANANGVTDIKLLDAAKFLAYIDGGGKIVMRQQLEAMRPDSSLTRPL